jgi:2-C-methyl-D-erythritol 4-phosphate cytidylyltransferase / 2-C-methyl-D-erythritol 2,4-cyclodiphosphate synthase
MSVGVIIVAGGRGLRFGGSVPKQLLSLGGLSILQRSVDVFDRRESTAAIIVVLPMELVERGPSLVGETRRPCVFVAGGERRQDSVRHGVAALPPDCKTVLIHDAARPFVTEALIDRVIAATMRTGAAVPATPSRDTVKRVATPDRRVTETIPREQVWLAQTPQGFTRSLLEGLMERAASGHEATDEAMLAEQAGQPVEVVPGDEGNVKITTTDDLMAARARLAAAPRVGTGYDLHRLVPDRPLILAGVVIPFDRGPLGHSDGDVICHALADAMFGAAGHGDIGQHFSNTDPRWKNVPGLELLRQSRAIVGESGYRVASADVTVILERPKLMSHVPAIRAALADVLGVELSAVNVKPKTNEGVDAVGRGEAIAAHAVAVLVRGDAR